jgi:hypothetical protein
MGKRVEGGKRGLVNKKRRVSMLTSVEKEKSCCQGTEKGGLRSTCFLCLVCVFNSFSSYWRSMREINKLEVEKLKGHPFGVRTFTPHESVAR